MRVLLNWLRGGPEQDFVDVDVVWLAYREGDSPGEGVRTHGDLAHELLRACLDILLADMIEKLGADGSGEMMVVRML